MTDLTPRWTAPLRTLWRPCLLMMVSLLAACSADSCGCEGFVAQDFPPEHYDKTMPQGAQIRLSPTGLDFVEQNIGPIIDGALPGGLQFCIATDTAGDPKLCYPYNRARNGVHAQGEQPFCSDGSQGCQITLSIEETIITPKPPNQLEVAITIGNLNPTVPFETDVAVIGNVKCDVTPYKKGADINTPATITAFVPITFAIDQMSPTKDLSIDVGEVELNLQDLDFDLKGGFKCGAADFLRGLFRGIIEDLVRDQLKDTVDALVAEQLCLSCAEDANACPDTASCGSDQICLYNNTQECVPAPLGIEGRMLMAQLIGDFTQEEDAEVDVMFKMADYVNVDEGVTLAGRTGFQSTAISPCAPIDPTTRPPFTAIPISPTITGDIKPASGQPFMVGVGVHKRTIEHLLWSTWASGATCLVAGSSVSEQLSTGTLSVLLRSISKLTDGKNREVELMIIPQRKPEVILGANTVVESGDSYEIQDGLMTIDWKDLDVHMYGYVQDRWTRLFTVRIDLLLPVAIVPDGMGQLGVVLGDFEAAIQNVRPRNSGILSDNPNKLTDLIPTLVGLAVPSLASALDLAFDLPEFFGLKLVLGQGDITSVDNNEMIAIFANLEKSSTMALSFPILPQPVIDAHEVIYPDEIQPDTLVRPVVQLSVRGVLPGPIEQALVAGEEVEFSWRINDGIWSMYRRSDTLRIDSAALVLPGEHTIEVRARMRGEHLSVNREVTASITIPIDYQPPTLEIEQREDRLRLVASDLTDTSAQLMHRWRIHDGQRATAWTDWSHATTLSIRELGVSSSFRIEAQARDRSGRITQAERTVHMGLEPAPDASPSLAQDASDTDAGGCAAARSPSPASPLLGALLLLGMFGMTRRRRVLALASALIGISALGTGCGGCTDAPPSGQTSQCDPECGENQVCENKVCVASPDLMQCQSDAECTDGKLCEGNVCVKPECSTDAECADSCGADKRGVCASNACACEDFCPQGCGDDTFCCFAQNACQPFPDACESKVCDPGFEPGETTNGTPNSQTCAVEGSTCDCVALPPLPLGYHGRYPSLARSATGELAVAAYNQTYGDLMVGTLTPMGDVSWSFVDGVPATGEITGALDGPRGGIRELGDNVGAHTAIAYDDAGGLHVFYQDLGAKALKYARSKGAGSLDFSVVTLDAEGDTGYWTQALFKDGALHLAYQSANVLTNARGGISQVRYLKLDPAMSADMIAANATPQILAEGFGAAPCDGSCTGEQVCMSDGGICITPTLDCAQDCADGSACSAGACVITHNPDAPRGVPRTLGQYMELTATPDGLMVLFHDGGADSVAWVTRAGEADWSMPRYAGAPSGPYASAMVDGAGVMHLAYMNEADYTLLYEQVDQLAPEVIISGLRDSADEWLLARIGEDVTLRMSAGGQPDVIFQDATAHTLMRATRQGAGQWAPAVLAAPGNPYTGAHGFYSTMIRSESDAIAVEYVVDSQADTPTAFPIFHMIP